MIDLLSTDDPDWALYQEGDPDFFLRVAGETIRTELGWHLFPNITETVEVPLGYKGIIMLPSRYVTKVHSVTAFHGIDEVLIDPTTYELDGDSGHIQMNSNAYGQFYRGFYYGPDPAIHVAPRVGYARVVMSHGYDTVPLDVKSVIFELADSTSENSSGNYEQIRTPDGFLLQPGKTGSGGTAFGMNMNADQCHRLSKYKIRDQG
jgi:hypothetical protein